MIRRLSAQPGAGKLAALEGEIRKLRMKDIRTRGADRRLADAFRTVLRMHQDAVRGRSPWIDRLSAAHREKLIDLAREGFAYLGGQGEPCSVSLKEYDHKAYGPYLGVSDEGSAAQVIRDAARRTPKMNMLKSVDPMAIGVSHDAERLGAIGEVAVGPREYAEIYLQCVGRVLTSTNVGTRLNVRHYLRHPLVIVAEGPRADALTKAKKELREKFRPFFETPDGKPRPITVYVKFDPKSRRIVSDKIAILKDLAAFVSSTGIADPKFHQLGLQQPVRQGQRARNAALLAIDMAAAAGLREVAIEGLVRRDAEESVSYPGLLNYYPPGLLGPILRQSAKSGVLVHPKNIVDTDTVARNVWSTLSTARRMGLALGKYGTFPLTLEECDAVIGHVQAWFRDWSAAPVFFVDQGVLSRKRVLTGRDVMAGIREWLTIAGRHGVPIVLIDTMDKAKGYRLLRTKDEPKGLLGVTQVKKIDRLAADMGIKALWAGGITLPQVFEFGKLGIFGIYVTTAVTAPRPVSKAYSRDPLLAAEKEPTSAGVFRAKLLLEAGFLSSREECRNFREVLEKTAGLLVLALADKRPESEIQNAENRLAALTTAAWARYRNSNAGRKYRRPDMQPRPARGGHRGSAENWITDKWPASPKS